jgi:hypothetical protein
MPTISLNAVGFCPHYSDQGDWAFDYALRLSRMHQIKLNVLHFMKDPYDPEDDLVDLLSDKERAEIAVKREKELRLYYDSRAGDYLNVGFRLCEHTEWLELHRCLVAREFQVLVLGHIHEGVSFGNRPIKEFAGAFVCPMVLVGPEKPNQFLINEPARMIVDKLGLEPGTWSVIPALAKSAVAGSQV